MMPAAEFTPYLLQQTALRASLLQSSFGFAAGDWDDLRQDLALDCLRRLPRFDGARGSWKGFVRGVVRNHACVLAARQVRRPPFEPLGSDAAADGVAGHVRDLSAADIRPALELSLDTERVLAGLPDDLRTIARYLAHLPISAACRRSGLTPSQMNRRIRRIRAAFTAAGLAPANGGGGR